MIKQYKRKERTKNKPTDKFKDKSKSADKAKDKITAKDKAAGHIDKNNGFLIGSVKKSGKRYVFTPRKIGNYYENMQIQNYRQIRFDKDGLYLAKVVKFPRGRIGVRIEKNIGLAGNLNDERESLLYEYQISPEFPQAVESESRSLDSRISRSEMANRVDLRRKLIFTIDGDRARDYDDAVGIERIESGYRLWVSIADVSYYVKDNTELDKEAYKRATSIYLVKKVIPMLPEKLSNDLCSLVPHKNRLTKTVEILFGHDGEVLSYKIYNSVIKSKYRLTYTHVSELLHGSIVISEKQKVLYNSLRLMQELFMKIKSRRISEGYIDLNIPDAEIVEDENGNVIDVIRLKREVSHEIIEQFMISANEAVAEYISRAKKCSMYRVHESPDAESIIELRNNLKALGFKSKKSPSMNQKEVQNILSYFLNKKEEYAANIFLLRSMKRAVYSSKNVGHYGLGSKYYTHFTSPIRRYPDLIVHRVLNSLINTEKVSHYDSDFMTKVSNHCSSRESLSDEIQRESVKLERAFLIKSYVGEILKGFIISIKPFGIFVELEEIFAEGFVPRRGISSYRESNYYIGQEIEVKVKNADIENRRVRLELVN